MERDLKREDAQVSKADEPCAGLGMRLRLEVCALRPFCGDSRVKTVYIPGIQGSQREGPMLRAHGLNLPCCSEDGL